jgi:predicted outer membrane protein
MSDSEKVKKFSISMEPDLMKWVDQKVKDLNKKDRRLKSSRSAVISDAVEQLRALESTGQFDISRITLNDTGNANPQNDSKSIIKPSVTSAGGYSTQKTANSLQTGKAK